MDRKDVIKWVKESDRIVLIYHFDTDGCSSGALIYKLLQKYEKTPILALPCTPTLPDNVVKKIKNVLPDLVVFVDLSIDQHKEKVLDLSEDRRLVIIDHHQIQNDMNRSNIIHLNSMFTSDKYTPCAKYIFDLFELEDFDWIAAAGVVGDSGVSEWKEFVEDVMRKYDLGSSENVRESLLGKIDEMISAGRILKNSDGAKTSYNILCRSDDLKDFIKNAEILEDWRFEVQAELKKLENDFEKYKEVHGDLFFFEVKSFMNISSVLSTVLGWKYTDRTIFLIKQKNNMTKIHLRRNDGKINLGKLVKKATSRFRNSAAGGHRNAAGGHVLKEDFDKFKERFLSYYLKV